ncbi:MAG: hypothetical protein Q9221_002534 [Calogaya cf. arnoldii]
MARPVRAFFTSTSCSPDELLIPLLSVIGTMAPANWETIRDRKLEEQQSRMSQAWLIPQSQLPADNVLDVTGLPRSCGILSSREIDITDSYDARGLAAAIRAKTYTAVEVTTAYCKRAAIANQLTSCLTECLFASALARAAFLDAYLDRTSQTLGPLHGLPISVKDTFDIKGIDSSVGISALAFHPAQENAPIIDTLLAAGAVIHCKTNVPQSMLALDSVNNIFGRVLNPRNRRQWTAGGSSGGEAVLVAMRGSVMGVGTDVGGSIRIPAFVNGIVGFKPGKGRISAKGLTTGQLPAAGKVGLEVCVGPIARTIEDLGLFMEIIENSRMWEIDADVKAEDGWWTKSPDTVLPLLRNPPHAKEKPLRIGILPSDGITVPLPPVTSTLHRLTQTLQNQTHKPIALIPLNPHTTGFSKCQSLANKFFSAEGSSHLLSLISSTSEPLIPWLSSRLRSKPPSSLTNFRSLLARKDELSAQLLRTIWFDDNRIDLLICPVAPHPVPRPDGWNAVGYTSAFVLLDWPAGVVQVGDVRREDLEAEMNDNLKGEWDRVNRGLWDKEFREGYVGSPMAVQVVAPPGRERRCWEGMRVLERIVRGVEGEKARL